ncbi:hypothetical protein A2U01_0061940, partial [Trifolium medium]|nr:hypothetical protein [Trifolium medium]
DFKYGLDWDDLLEKNLDIRSGTLGARFNEVIWWSRRCGHCGMVEQATMSIGFNYDDLVIIGATDFGIKSECCAARVSEPSVVRRQLYERWVP